MNKSFFIIIFKRLPEQNPVLGPSFKRGTAEEVEESKVLRREGGFLPYSAYSSVC